MPKQYALRCKIAAGGFPHERQFDVCLVDGSQYVSVTPDDYVQGDDRLVVRVLKNGRIATVVQAPDGEVLKVRNGDLERVSREGGNHVLVKQRLAGCDRKR